MSYPDGIPGEPLLFGIGYAVAQVPRLWRGLRGGWLEGDHVRCPECGKRAQLEHWYGIGDCSQLSTECCNAVVVAELEVNGALTYPYGVNLWKVKTTRKATR